MTTITRILTLGLTFSGTIACGAVSTPSDSARIQSQDGRRVLCEAIKSDNITAVQRLMIHAASLCPPSERGRLRMSEAQKLAAVLCYAASVNAVNTMKWLLAQKVNPDDTRWNTYNHHAHDGRTALHVAAAHAQAEAVELLLASGANPDAIDREGNTPLMLAAAAQSGDVKREWQTVDCLLKAGADPARRNREGKNAAEMTQNAEVRVNLSFCGVFTRWGKIDVNSVTFEPCEGLFLRQCLLSGNEHAVESELKRGENVNCRYEYGETPLVLAVRRGDANMVRLLLRYGATLPSDEASLYPMLYAAVLSGCPELPFLLPYQEPGESSGWESPLVVALRGKCGPAMTAALIQCGANAEARSCDRSSFTPLHYARMSGDDVSAAILRGHMRSDWSAMDDILKEDDAEGLRTLLATHCFFAIDARGQRGDTPLRMAEKAGQEEIAELLRVAGADEKALPTPQGQQIAPHIEDYAEFAAQVKKSVEQGDASFFLSLPQEDVNRYAGPVFCQASAFDPGPAKDCYYLAPPLKHAAAAGKEELVRVLLARGAELEESDIFGRTAIECAAANGHVECVRLLLNAGAACYREALYSAALCGQHAVVDYLLSRGVLPGMAPEWALMSENPHPGLLALRKPDVDIALTLAVQLDYPEAVKRLVAMGANVNRPNFYPLHTTFVADMVRALAECGADLNRRNAEGLTPLENARRQNFTLAAEALEKLTQATQK